MLSGPLPALLSLIFLAASLAGCASGAAPIGLAPALNAADLQASTDNYIDVERLLIQRAGFDEPPPHGEGKWYPVVVAGYSYVDEKCNAFMDELFEADRRLRAARNQLSDIATTTTAILTATSAARADIGIIAAAFGLASQTIDNYQIVRLVDLGPTKVHNLVAKAQHAYRTKTNNDWPLFGNRAFAMQAVAGYLDLCRVPTIVTAIDKAIEVADFVPDDAGIQLSPKLRMVGGSEPSTNSIREDAGLSALPSDSEETSAAAFARGQFGDSRTTRVTVITPPAPPSVKRIAGGMSDFEKDITVSRGKTIQKALCVSDDGDFGGETSQTRIAIREFKKHWAEQEDDDLVSGTSGTLTSLWASHIEVSRPCAGYNTLYEKLRWSGVRGVAIARNNKTLADALIAVRQGMEAAPAGTQLPAGLSLDDVSEGVVKNVRDAKDLNGSVRKAFATISRARQLGGGSTLDEKLWMAILDFAARKTP